MPGIVIPPTKRKETAPGWLTIGSLARATGVAPSTIRTWERRYQVLEPVRKSSGHRLYPAESVRHILAIRRALDLGHTPAEVIRLPLASLESLAGAAAPGRPATSAADDPSLERLLEAAGTLDRVSLRRLLLDAWARLGPIDCLEQAVEPFLTAVGTRWSEGSLSIRHEHFASAVVADFLREARRPFDERAAGPRLAAATLEGDLHELGLLGVALVAAVHGWRVAYLGANAPAAEIAAFARDADVRAVAVSISISRREGAAELVRGLRAALPRTIELWAGGEGTPADLEGVVGFADLQAFAARLRA